MVLVCEITLAMAQSTCLIVLVCEITLAMAQSTWS